MEARMLPGLTAWRFLELAVFLIIAAAWFYSIRYFGLRDNVRIGLYFLVFLVVEIAARAVLRRIGQKFPVELKLP